MATDIVCPHCNSVKNGVVDVRPTKDKIEVRRRRKCLNCEKRFNTFEKVISKIDIIDKIKDLKELFYSCKGEHASVIYLGFREWEFVSKDVRNIKYGRDEERTPIVLSLKAFRVSRESHLELY